MEYTRSESLFERACEVIPGGIPGIRSPDNYVRGAYPILLDTGRGGKIRDVDDNEFIDLLLGYGPIILGHAEPSVDAAASSRAGRGFCLNLPEPLIVELAERLVAIVPSAEQALFFKTGSGATTAGIRIARAHTSRAVVLRCGYHGWHDWCAGDDPGITAGAIADVHAFPYNDLDGLETLLQRHAGNVAAIILTPIGHEFDQQIEPPAEGFLAGVRRLADEHETVLVFDEVRSGFRVHLGGAQALYGVTPDLTALGKAMGNGYPITALVGSRTVMQSAQLTFMSSTYFGNSMEMAAALRTLELLERHDVLGQISTLGETLANELDSLIAETDLPVTRSPYPQMPFLHFDPALAPGQDARRDRFYGALAANGVFAHPKHHGFLCWRHSDAELGRVMEAFRAAAATR